MTCEGVLAPKPQRFAIWDEKNRSWVIPSPLIVQPSTMRLNPLQLFLDLPGSDTAYEFQTVKFNSALPAVIQENVDMRQQVIASVNDGS
jgi:hypothetical protein